MKKSFWQISILLILSMLTINALAEPNAEHKPKIRAGTSSGLSTNWAGYALDSPVGSVTHVNGSWIVPTVSCSKRQNTYSSFWVGIDGDASSTVEQIGTDSDCSNGRPNYYAWYEFYPAYPINGIIPVSPGDKISADVSYDTSSNLFTVSIVDHNNGKSSTTTQAVSGAQRNSAEWIAEAPSSIFGVLQLANFGTAYYGFDYTGDINTNYATINGNTGNISSFSPSTSVNVNKITMVTNRLVLKAQPSTVSSDGTSFSVKWSHS
jgi:hypothetical protein